MTFVCKGCSNEFCQKGFEELNVIINDYDQFKQKFDEQKQNISLLQHIDQWEINSIKIIKQKAENCRKILIKQTKILLNNTENEFVNLSKQIKEIHELNEIDLDDLRNKLRKLRKELNNSRNISVRENSLSTFTNEISITSSSSKRQFKQDGKIVAGGNGQGIALNQLSNPSGIFVNEEKTIFIADYANDRIIEWKYDENRGNIIAGTDGRGIKMNQLSYPGGVVVNPENHSMIIADLENRRVIQWCSNEKQEILIDNILCWGLTMDKFGYVYVSDTVRNEVRRWKIGEKQGTLVAGGNGHGNQLNQLNQPTYIFVDENQSIYISDYGNHRIMKWRKDSREGIVVTGGNGQGKNLNQLSCPEGVFVDEWNQIYVVDSKNNRIIRWHEGDREGEIVIGGNGRGNQINQMNSPRGLSFDLEGNIYVSDSWNHRILRFDLVL